MFCLEVNKKYYFLLQDTLICVRSFGHWNEFRILKRRLDVKQPFQIIVRSHCLLNRISRYVISCHVHFANYSCELYLKKLYQESNTRYNWTTRCLSINLIVFFFMLRDFLLRVQRTPIITNFLTAVCQAWSPGTVQESSRSSWYLTFYCSFYIWKPVFQVGFKIIDVYLFFTDQLQWSL